MKKTIKTAFVLALAAMFLLGAVPALAATTQEHVHSANCGCDEIDTTGPGGLNNTSEWSSKTNTTTGTVIKAASTGTAPEGVAKVSPWKGVTKETVYLRKEAKSSTDKANLVTKLRKGTEVTVSGSSGKYYYLTSGSFSGFARTKDIEAAAATTAPVSGNAATSSASTTVGGNNSSTASSSTYAVASDDASVKVTSTSSANPSGNVWGHFKVSGTNINKDIMSNAKDGKGQYKYAAYGSGKNYLFAMGNYGDKYPVIMGHNMRKSGSGFHQLHHVQNAWLGKSTCEYCKKSCSGAKTSVFNVEYGGYSKWQLVCFYEVGKSEPSSTLSGYVTGAMGGGSSWFNTLKGKCTSSNGGAVVDNSATGGDKLMLLVTCGNSYDSNNRAKLYMVLKAIG